LNTCTADHGPVLDESECANVPEQLRACRQVLRRIHVCLGAGLFRDRHRNLVGKRVRIGQLNQIADDTPRPISLRVSEGEPRAE
jgi:hypothetical protein